jgi:tRNA-modifying protein YgfZ
MPITLTELALPALGAVRSRGGDCVRFLQGQLSQDVARVSTTRSALAGYHNPQGRVIALLRLVALGENDLLAVLPRELAAAVATRLGQFVLRAKVTIADESDAWEVRGILDDGERPDWPRQRDAQVEVNEARVVCVASSPVRWLHVAPRSGDAPPTDASDAAAWRKLEIAAGQPQVFTATSEVFVAQMLNLDALDAISFDKGCYTGQEIIARAHYRGRIKRRMQRFRASAAPALEPGDRGRLADGRAFQVVQSAATDGGVEFLAVTVLPEARSETGPEDPEAGAPLLAEAQPLPYDLPA